MMLDFLNLGIVYPLTYNIAYNCCGVIIIVAHITCTVKRNLPLEIRTMPNSRVPLQGRTIDIVDVPVNPVVIKSSEGLFKYRFPTDGSSVCPKLV